MSGETLKPCPWCNSKAVLWKADNHEEWFIGCGGECSVNPGRHFDTREDAIAAWNTRHAPTVEGGELATFLRNLAKDYGNASPVSAMLEDAAAALASRDAEIERLSAALGEAERAINRAKEAVEDQDDIELVGSLDAALSTLKTAREG